MSDFIHRFLNVNGGNRCWNLYVDIGEDYLQTDGASIIRTLNYCFMYNLNN